MLQQTLNIPRTRVCNAKALARPASFFVLRPLEYAAECLFYAVGAGFLVDFLLQFSPAPAIQSLWLVGLLHETAAPVMNSIQAALLRQKFLPTDIYKVVPLALSIAAWLLRPGVKRRMRRVQDKLEGASAESLFQPRPVESSIYADGVGSSSYELSLGDDFSSARLLLDDAPAESVPADTARVEAGSPIVTSLNQVLRTIGRFELIQEVGRGPASAVYKALDLKLGRIVALKALLPDRHSSQEIHAQREKLSREARTAAKLTHPGIVAVYDTAEDTLGNPYIVMEYVDGETLSQALHRRHLEEPMSLAERLELAIQIARTLDYAHRAGVIHRDIKPSNVLLTSEGNAKIADFGIAMHLGGDSPEGDKLPGTPAFVAPELLHGAPAKAASDIFSLGVLMYWMFTGEMPFTGNSVTEIVHQVTYADPIPARRVNWALPEELDGILLRCLHKSPADRYSSAGELAAELTAMRDGQLSRARLSA
jgi:tRNA A-37 threonylcarbamoyl transferase component Bud32